MSGTRKRRGSISPDSGPTDIGPVWLVSTEHDHQYVAASDATAAIEVFLDTPRGRATVAESIIEVKLVATSTYARTVAGHDGDGGQS